MKPVAYVSLPIAEFREKVFDFGSDYEAIGKWIVLFSKTLSMMGSNEPKDDFAMRLLAEVETWRKDKAEKMRKKREEQGKQPVQPTEESVVEPETVKAKPVKKVVKKMFGELQNVMLSYDEEAKLRERLVSSARFERAISILSSYKASSGKKYKSDYAAIINWVIERVDEESRKSGKMSQAQRLALGMLGGANG